MLVQCKILWSPLRLQHEQINRFKSFISCSAQRYIKGRTKRAALVSRHMYYQKKGLNRVLGTRFKPIRHFFLIGSHILSNCKPQRVGNGCLFRVVYKGNIKTIRIALAALSGL
jgi:hypothetical protein